MDDSKQPGNGENNEGVEVNEILRALVEASPLAIVALDPHQNIIMWNPAAERIFGWHAAEVLGRPSPIIPEEKMDECEMLYQQALAGGSTTGLVTRRKKKDGSEIEVSISTATLRDSNGMVSGFMGVLADITEQRTLEEQLRQSQKIEAVGRLAGGVAHDFNNLLTVIIGYSDLALYCLDDKAELQKKIEEIRKAAEKATSLTRQLLAYSRKQMVQPKALNLNTVVMEMKRIFSQLIGEDINLVTHLEPALGQIKADTGQMEQVVLNLVVNSRDAMPQGGTISVETRNIELNDAYARRHIEMKPGSYIMVVVNDTGCGISEKTQKHIFEPFFTTKELGKGTGLGLSTVYAIVKQSGGHIQVQSKVGQGTRFTIYLPRVMEAADATVPALTTATIPRCTETILVVDDDENVRNLICETLRTSGYTVLRASHGGQAISICQQHKGPIHLMLSDVVMPQISGRELAERLSLAYPNMKMLFMSGYTEDILVRHIALDAAPLFLEKPFTPIALAIKVRQALDAPGASVS